MGSTRLPGKTLKIMNKEPMIWYVIERLKLVPETHIVVLTSDKAQDDELETWCKKHKVQVFRGSEDNVLERYYLAAKEFNADNIIRATGDNPLVEPFFAKQLLDQHSKHHADYSSNKSEVGSTLPDGLGVEIFTFEALETSYKYSSLDHHFEHVNEYILGNQEQFNIFKDTSCGGVEDRSGIRLTVDTPDDFSNVEKIIADHSFTLDITYQNLLKVVE